MSQDYDSLTDYDFVLPWWRRLMTLADAHASGQCVAVSNIKSDERQRNDYGDLTGLIASIKQFGIIQPIVLQRRGDTVVLVAGGRRLASLRQIGVSVLNHGKEFVWRDEDLSSAEGGLRLQAVELEENLRRKDLAWPEVILAKAKLFELMQSIHGESKGFGGGRSGVNAGFSLRKLAAMLGENPSVTSRDLELAGFVAKHPALAQMPTKADAMRKLGVAVTVAAMQALAKTSSVASSTSQIAHNSTGLATSAANVDVSGVALPEALVAPVFDERWSLYEGRFQDNITQVNPASVDLVCTDLPYNIGLGNSTASHAAGLGQFIDDDINIVDLCSDVAVHAFRVLRDNRFAVFFYGMNYHGVLYDTLTTAGFSVDVYPFIWIRDRSAPPDGFARYAKSYDPCFIASKGTPRFIRPNAANSVAIPSVRGPERLHAAQKPVAVMQKFIEDMTTPNCVVLDMFAGAGTTGEAALRTGRKAILFELEPNNCTLIRARLGSI